ncbi:MAG: hypothetical protein ABFD97_09895 [Syntrophobacter sp.]
MNTKLIFSVSIFAVAFALVFGFGSINNVNASPENYNAEYVGEANLIGVDEAHNSLASRDKDSGSGFTFESHGLNSEFSPER